MNNTGVESFLRELRRRHRPSTRCPVDKDRFKNSAVFQFGKMVKAEERNRLLAKRVPRKSKQSSTKTRKGALPPFLESQWILNIQKRVGNRIYSQGSKESLDNLMDEIRKDYVKSMESKDPRSDLKQSEDIHLRKVRSLLAEVSPEWSLSTRTSTRYLVSKLHQFHPCVQKNALLGQISLANGLISSYHLKSRTFSTLGEFEEAFDKMCERREYNLLSKWWKRAQNVIRENSPDDARRFPLQHSVFILLALQIKNFKRQSLENLRLLFIDTDNPILQIKVSVVQQSVCIYPTTEHLEASVVTVLQRIDSSLDEPLRKLKLLLSEQKENNQYLCQITGFVPEFIVRSIKESILARLIQDWGELEQWVKDKDSEFCTLVNGKDEQNITGFLSTERSLTEMIELIGEYRAKSSTLKLLPKELHFRLLLLDTSDFVQTLEDNVNILTKKLLSALQGEQVKEFLRLQEEFRRIQESVSRLPSTTKDMLAMAAHLEDISVTQLPKLAEEIQASSDRLLYLLENNDIDDDDRYLIATVLDLPKAMEPYIDRCTQMLDDSKSSFEEKIAMQIDDVSQEVAKLLAQVKDFDTYGDVSLLPQYLMESRFFWKRIERVFDTIAWINQEETYFKVPPSSYPDADSVRQEMYPHLQLYLFIQKWHKTEKKWLDFSFLDLNSDYVEAEMDRMTSEIYELQKIFRGKFKSQLGPGARRGGIGADKGQSSGGGDLPPPLRLCQYVIEKMSKFKENLPVIGVLCNPGLKRRHWRQMSGILGADITPDTGSTLRRMLQHPVETHLTQLEAIASTASKEYSLEQALVAMRNEWSTVAAPLQKYKDEPTWMLSSAEEIQNLLDDHLVRTQTMRGSPFSKPIEKHIKEWETQLAKTQSILDFWLNVQSQWLYLEPIFCSEDIMLQIPEEGKLFKAIDQDWREAMQWITEHQPMLEATKPDFLLDRFTTLLKYLDIVSKGLNRYLEQKRLIFPRFFFLSNDEMLEILSETKDPLRVQPHLKKCFEGISSLTFDPELRIVALHSKEGETVSLVKPVDMAENKDQVEKWLLKVQDAMVDSVRSLIQECRHAYENSSSRSVWSTEWAGQAVLCVSQIYWTADVTTALVKGRPEGLKLVLENQEANLSSIVNLVRSPLPPLVRTTLGALIVLDVHARDVVAELLQKGIADEKDFTWQSQLRYYCENGDVTVAIMQATTKYSYEYLGNSDRLVMTPLTDRCYRTLMSAFQLHLNGAPEGPAGTGKTETTKDLAKALAVQCVVFNCSEGLDYLAMGKFFKGLASSGAWACFDEFNRIELEVLSVVAQQILCISQAVQAGLTRFLFEGTELQLNKMCYVCITMNPDYAGRSQLPDNLKVLFRTVAMMVPDYAMIAEILLYSSGFLQARHLAAKLVTVFRLCSEQLSPQWHYDYGMRALKAVLAAAGGLKLLFPQEDEDALLLRSVINVNMPKFLSHDIPLFLRILSDLFPGLDHKEAKESTLLSVAKEVCRSFNLQPVESFLQKVLQTNNVMMGRHGFMLVGEPCSGKSSILRVLAESLSRIHTKPVLTQTINPKVLTLAQLYGHFDPVSREWTDGLIALAFRRYAAIESDERKWIVFDGPVDTLWVESMNTVLDDNKKLCLMSGETIALTPSMNLIFEVMDLAQASPATVSRCGMVYLEPDVLGWRPLFQSWINTVPEKWKFPEFLWALGQWLIPPALDFLRNKCTTWIPISDLSLVMSMTSMITMMMDKGLSNSRTGGGEDPRHLRTWVIGSYAFGLAWSLGGTLDTPSREKYSAFIKELLLGSLPLYPIPEDVGKVECPFPIEGLIYDYSFEFRGRNQWSPWSESLYLLDDDKLNIREVIVPTIDTIRYSYLMDLYIKNKKPLLLVGPTGTGKSVYARDKLIKGLPSTSYLPILLSFCANTSAALTQEIIMSKLEKRRKGFYGPPVGKQCIVLVDDLNMPQPEKYGAHPPLEMIRQLLDHGFWYYGKDLLPCHLLDLQVLAVMGPAGGARSEVTPRLLRHFGVLAINPFSQDTMTRIFTTLMNIHLRSQTFPVDMFSAVGVIVRATLDVYQSAIVHLLPTPTKSHYIFNLRDFARVIYGCCLIRRESVPNRRVFVRLWAHEIMRVFYDRLQDEADKAWLFNVVRDCVKVHFKESFELVFAQQGEFGKVTEESMKNLMFGNYMSPDASQDDKIYEEVTSIEAFENVVQCSLKEYNTVHKATMKLVIFRYVLEHLSRISRILATPGGHALLVGVGGSGRQSITRLAAFMAGYTIFQPENNKHYSFADWRDDLKLVLKMSGAQGKEVVFLVSDSIILEERYLEDLDILLNSGEIPNIFNVDEKQEIIEAVQSHGVKKNVELTLVEVYDLFVQRCRQKLHVIIAFSPIGTSFYRRIRQFPSLVNCCTINWFQPWPDEALQKVADSFLEDVAIPYQIKPSVSKLCRHFHTSVTQLSQKFQTEQDRWCYVTPSSYLELLGCYKELLFNKQQEFSQSRKRYLAGLDKLSAASQQVARMQQELEELQPQLVVAAKEAAQMITTIGKETTEAEKKRQMVREDEILANQQAAESQTLKEECESDLASALPALESAVSALDTLKPADITLVRSMKNPPKAVKLVMAAVCVMKGMKPDKITDPASGKKTWDYWGPSKKVLSDLSFLAKLKEYDKDNIPANVMDIIRRDYLTSTDFRPRVVAKASSAAMGLCKWVIAMEFYDKVAKMVAPKREKLVSAEQQLEETISALSAKQEELQAVEEHVKALEQRYQELCQHKKHLEVQVEVCSRKLDRAQKLLKGLAGERERWSLEADLLHTLYNNLPGDILLASGVIAYLGPYTAAYRKICLSQWIELCQTSDIPASTDFSLSRMLGHAEEIQHWNQQGLPRDAFSVDNAIIIHNSRRWPLIIDPEGQANKWLNAMEKDLVVTEQGKANFLVVLKTCIQLGKPLLVEKVGEELDPRLDPVLMKNTFKQGGVEMLQLGDVALEYNPGFRLYITTRLRNPHYLPETATKVSLLNFMITPEGLEDQLLGILVSRERPELEKERQELIDQIANNRRSLKAIEDEILRTLAASQGNILEDETAIHALDNSKILADEVAVKQKVAEETEELIESSRLEYQPVAFHSCSLFFCLANLPNVDPMYQYSLGWFIELYVHAIKLTPQSNSLEKRLSSLKKNFTYSFFCSVSRSLLEKHKLLFAFILSCSFKIAKKELDPAELQFLVTGGVSLQSSVENPAQDWLENSSWDQLCNLANTIPSYADVRDDLMKRPEVWKQSLEAVDVRLPERFHESLGEFQQIVVLRCVRLHKILPRVMRFVASSLGEEYTRPTPFDLPCSFEDSTPASPLVFILSQGSNPMANIMSFAKEKGKSEETFSISLGQGQGPFAEKTITRCRLSGGWVVLQNCHLAESWMPVLERICEDLSLTPSHPEFRLWLTSYPSVKFPISVLRKAVKMTNESPRVLRDNVLYSFKSQLARETALKSKTMCRIVFSLCTFHAVMQERLQYGSIGWNIPYRFDSSDLDITLRQLAHLSNGVHLDALRYLVGECNYGGKVTDDWDRRCMTAILEDFLNSNVIEERQEMYRFTEDENYHLIPNSTFSNYVEYVQGLPSECSPLVMGLHPEVEIRRQSELAREFLDTLLLTQKSGSSTRTSGSDSSSDTLLRVVAEIRTKLPDEMQQRSHANENLSMIVVLKQEVEKYNRLLNTIRKSMDNLENALAGKELMTAQLDGLSISLLTGKVPDMWTSASYLTRKPLASYINDLATRVDFFRTWMDSGSPPVSYWLSAFFFPHAFLTSVLQSCTRSEETSKSSIPVAINQLMYDFQVMDIWDPPPTPPTIGVYVHGLFLEGASWDFERKCLSEQSKGIHGSAMPLIWLKPVIKEDFQQNGRYECPVYRTSLRRGALSTTGHSTNFVLAAYLPSELPEEHWVKRGTALLCQLDS